MPKYPNITVELVGKDGNAFNILGICRRAMKRAHPAKESAVFTRLRLELRELLKKLDQNF